MTHTPGPWTLEGGKRSSDFELHGDGWYFADLLDAGAGVDSMANARLIAAAPDLLAALEGLFEHCCMVHRHWGDGCNQKEADAAIERAKAAVVKAGGTVHD